MQVELSERRTTYRGAGDAWTRSVELVVTPLIFAGIGYLFDRWLGWSPVLTLALLAFGVVGTFIKMWLGYDREMRAHEAGAPWRRPAPSREQG